MGAGEGGKDKLSGVGLTLTDMHARYFLIGLYKVRHIGKIKLQLLGTYTSRNINYIFHPINQPNNNHIK